MRGQPFPMGIWPNMPLTEYLAIAAMSASALKLLARSPWHYANRVEEAETPSMFRGNLAHCAILEPKAMNDRYVVVPADAPKRPTAAQWAAKKPNESSIAAMAWWTKFGEENAGRVAVSTEDFELCKAQVEAVLRVPELAEPLRDGSGEVSIFWIDKDTGLYCKARPDWLPQKRDGVITPIDLKTCVDESPEGFSRAAARMRYDLQAVHYTAGIEAVTGARVDKFVFGAVTNKPPVLAVPYVLADDVRDRAQADRRELLQRLTWCREQQQWPAYGEGYQVLDFPAWMKRDGEVEVEWSEEA